MLRIHLGSGLASGLDDGDERVINVNICPLCHRRCLNSKAEVDIVTHLVVCASRDWDRIVVGNFLSASQSGIQGLSARFRVGITN